MTETTATETTETPPCRVTVNAVEFRKAVNLGASVVDRRASIPCLHWINLVRDGGDLIVHAADLDTLIEVRIAAEFDSAGVPDGSLGCVGAESLAKLLKNSALVGATVDVVIGGDAVTVNGARLPLHSSARFPARRELPVTLHTLSGATLAEMMRRTLPAVSKEGSRYTLQGVYLGAEKGDLIACGTNGHWLSLVTGDDPAGDKWSLMVPTAMAQLVSKNPGSGGASIGENAGDGLIVARFGSVTVWAQRLTEKFPNIWAVLPDPKRPECVIKGDAAAWRKALKAVKVFAPGSLAVTLKIAKDGTATLSACNDSGSLEEPLKVDPRPGTGAVIRFNWQYLDAWLGALAKGQVAEIGIGERNALGHPVAISCIARHTEGVHHVAVIMPLRD